MLCSEPLSVPNYAFLLIKNGPLTENRLTSRGANSKTVFSATKDCPKNLMIAAEKLNPFAEIGSARLS